MSLPPDLPENIKNPITPNSNKTQLLCKSYTWKNDFSTITSSFYLYLYLYHYFPFLYLIY